MAITGFEPLDIVQGILANVQQLESGRTDIENSYPRAVTFEGNLPAQKTIEKVFQE